MLRSRGRQTSRLVAAFLAAATITAVWTTTAVRYSTKAEQIATKVLRGDLAGLTQSLYTVASSEKHLISLEEEQTDWQYTCWQREGSPTRGQPDVTVISVVSGLPGNYPKFLRKNRLAYVAQHGYMYCELNSLDTTRIAPWTKLPWILSLLPCTDYVVHLDADALIVNHTRSLQPWLDYMVEKDIEFLVPNDFGNYAAINFGVFMVRPASWLYSFFQDLYNRCACAWGRTHDWPAEQGLLYDIMVERPDAAKRTKIIEYDRWNIMLPKIPYDMDPRDVIIHVTWAKPRPSSKKCFDDQGNDVSTAECKYDGILYLYEQVSDKYFSSSLKEYVRACSLMRACAWMHVCAWGSVAVFSCFL
jgi:hypothetical protein